MRVMRVVIIFLFIFACSHTRAAQTCSHTRAAQTCSAPVFEESKELKELKKDILPDGLNIMRLLWSSPESLILRSVIGNDTRIMIRARGTMLSEYCPQSFYRRLCIGSNFDDVQIPTHLKETLDLLGCTNKRKEPPTHSELYCCEYFRNCCYGTDYCASRQNDRMCQNITQK